MNSVVCTLFEGGYSHGVAALANSFSATDFKGTIIAGYRGALPKWMLRDHAFKIDRCDLRITERITIKFLPITTNVHLTNYKPDFMLRLLEHEASYADSLLYMDPDITLSAPWEFITRWMECGVMLCEDVNSPLARNHPRRVGWRKFFAHNGIPLEFRESAYVNGGCVGVHRKDIVFLRTWQDLQSAMAAEIGGLGNSKLGGGTSERMRDPHFYFNASDQDALNATIEATPDIPVSILGTDAMGFRPGLAVLPHALGTPKPWQKHYLRDALAGRPPTHADKAFWKNVDGPIKPFNAVVVRRKRFALKFATLIGRFIRRT